MDNYYTGNVVNALISDLEDYCSYTATEAAALPPQVLAGLQDLKYNANGAISGNGGQGEVPGLNAALTAAAETCNYGMVAVAIDSNEASGVKNRREQEMDMILGFNPFTGQGGQPPATLLPLANGSVNNLTLVGYEQGAATAATKPYDYANTQKTFVPYLASQGDYVPQKSTETYATIAAQHLNSLSITGTTLQTLNAALPNSNLAQGGLVYVPESYQNVTNYTTTPSSLVSEPQNLKSDFVYDVAGQTLYALGDATDDSNANALIIDQPDANGTFATFDQGSYGTIDAQGNGTISITLDDNDVQNNQLGTIGLNPSGGGTFTLAENNYGGPTLTLPTETGLHVTAQLASLTPEQVLLAYLSELGSTASAAQLDQDSQTYLFPNGTTPTTPGQPLYTQGNGAILTQTQFRSVSLLSGGGQIFAASSGNFNLTSANVDQSSSFNLTATDWGGTTLTGNNQSYQNLTASLFGNDTLQAGNGTGDSLVAGQGVDKLIGGTGGDSFSVSNGVYGSGELTAGSTIMGKGMGNTLTTFGDITGDNISGIQTLQAAGNITLNVSEFSGFTTIDAGNITLFAATAGTYNLAAKNGSQSVSMTAMSSGGTTLIGNGGVDETLTASATGNDTLAAGSGSGDRLIAGSGTDTLTAVGANATILAGSGADTITAALNTSIYGGGGTYTLNGTGSTNSISGGGGTNAFTIQGTGNASQVALNDGDLLTLAGTNNSTTYVTGGDAETITGTSDSTLLYGSGTFVLAGGNAVTVTDSGSGINTIALTGNGDSGVINNSNGLETLIVGGSSNTMVVENSESGYGNCVIYGTNALLQFDGATSDTVQFNDAGTLQLNAASSFAGEIVGISSGDRIDLRNFQFSGTPAITSVTGTGAINTTTNVTVTDGSQSVVLSLLNQVANQYSRNVAAYSLTSDGASGTPGTFFQLSGGQVPEADTQALPQFGGASINDMRPADDSGISWNYIGALENTLAARVEDVKDAARDSSLQSVSPAVDRPLAGMTTAYRSASYVDQQLALLNQYASHFGVDSGYSSPAATAAHRASESFLQLAAGH